VSALSAFFPPYCLVRGMDDKARSAEWRSAVSQNCILRGVSQSEPAGTCRRPADWKSALRFSGRSVVNPTVCTIYARPLELRNPPIGTWVVTIRHAIVVLVSGIGGAHTVLPERFQGKTAQFALLSNCEKTHGQHEVFNQVNAYKADTKLMSPHVKTRLSRPILPMNRTAGRACPQRAESDVFQARGPARRDGLALPLIGHGPCACRRGHRELSAHSSRNSRANSVSTQA